MDVGEGVTPSSALSHFWLIPMDLLRASPAATKRPFRISLAHASRRAALAIPAVEPPFQISP